jgi:hypothetical protein
VNDLVEEHAAHGRLYFDGADCTCDLCRTFRGAARIERLRVALLSNQWGSCDGCNNGHNYCPECKAPREWWSETHDDLVPGVHFAGCSIAVALDLPMRTR